MNRFYTLIVILLVLSSWVHPVGAQDASTWMPDANLRTAVRENLGLANGVALTQAKMLDLTSLHASRARIRDLTGLEHATNLTSLVAFQNQISSLTPLENLTSLTDLRMGNNDISDVTPLDDLTSLTRLGLQKNDISNVTPLAGLVNLKWLRLAGNPISDLSPLVTLVNVKDSDVDLPEPDTTAPSVSISVPSGTQNGAFNATIRFTETVSGFVGSDVSLSGSAAGITSWSANSANTVYTATITPTASGTVTIGVAANVATDAAGNNNTAATSKNVTVSVDTTAPGVTVSVPSGTQNGAFNATIRFTETVSGFVGSDVSLTGSAASITSWTSNPWNDVEHTVSITPTTSGQLTISVPAGVATDTTGNPNTASTPQTVTVDVDKPTVSIGVPSGTQTGAFDTTLTFSETVSGFAQSDVSLSGSAASITSWSANSANTVYTATITPTASGTVTIGVAANVATDAVNNQNTAATSKTVTVDVDKPTVSIGVPSGTQNGAFNATITFSETVSGFAQSDVSLTGSAASITSWSANSDDTVYTATITPTASGTVTVSVAADVATDAANNPNTAATSQTVTISLPETTPDPATWMPDANLRAGVRSALGIASNANFSKDDLSTLTSLHVAQSQVADLTGLEYATNLTSLVAWGNQISSLTPLTNLTKLTEIRIGDNQHIQNLTPLAGLTKLTKLGLQGNNISNVTPLAGLVNLTWLRLVRNPITDFSPLVTLVNVTDSDVDLPEPDTTAPGVSISVPSGVQNGAFSVTITFTETVSGFTQSEVSLSGSAASITSWSANKR